MKLRDAWLQHIAENPSGRATVDVLNWLSRATLDIIGLAGFDYSFNAVAEGETNELARAFQMLFMPPPHVRVFIAASRAPTKTSRVVASN